MDTGVFLNDYFLSLTGILMILRIAPLYIILRKFRGINIQGFHFNSTLMYMYIPGDHHIRYNVFILNPRQIYRDKMQKPV